MSRRRTAESLRRVPRDGELSFVAHWRKERAIRRVLRALSRQRVASIVQPGNMLVVERGPWREPSEAALRTCHLRGWAEPIANAVRSGTLGPDGTIPGGQVYDRIVPIYRITDAGWNVLQRTHFWVIWTFIIAFLSLGASVLGVVASGWTWETIFSRAGEEVADNSIPVSDGRVESVDAAGKGSARVRSRDGVEIAYETRGFGDKTLLFIHGGLADRRFWTPQMSPLSTTYRVVAIDLAGHGESGRNRQEWTMIGFAEDVRAVAEALDLRRTVLIGNSLGGPVALEATRLLGDRVIGVIGVDTLHDVTVPMDRATFEARAAAFRSDFAGACRSMIDSLFHTGTYPDLRAWAERRMRAMSPEIVAGIMERAGGYDLAAAFRAAGVPIRAINGDLWPTRVEANRTLAREFDAVVMAGAGHYPMLERPEEFNRHLVRFVEGLEASKSGTGC